jgi:predicted HTH transcriptional regulator
MEHQTSGTRLTVLIDDLRALAAEQPCVEFKQNNADPAMIGKLISALSNAARLADQPFSYVLWGVHDADHSVTGTTFDPSSQMEQRQPLELWLAQRLQPDIAFCFRPIENYHGKRLVLLEIPAAAPMPVEFDRTAYIRIGSATPRLSEHPERLRALWAKLQPYAWEAGIAAQFLTGDEVLAKLDYARYFDMTAQPLPDNRIGIFDKLAAERLIQSDVGGHWNITNLGAILFAKRLSDFPAIARKAIRFVAYSGQSRADTVTHRQDVNKGYTIGFQELIGYIDGLLPQNEHIVKAFRVDQPLYPAIAIRELVANALIHQDMTITGAGPLIELFKDRLEITNPGQPLVSPDRFLDSPPRSRNEALAALMRRMRLCEEQGTGIDKVLVSIEFNQLPPPDFRSEGEAVRAVLFAPRRFADMTQEERMRACFQHAGLKYVSGQKMTNSTLRERFGISTQNAAQASAVIRHTLAKGLIRSSDPEHPRTGYIPFWA